MTGIELSASPSAGVDYLPWPRAHDALRESLRARPQICHDVYQYWAAKRKRLGRPLVRRLQAPTPASDNNPFNTFRCAWLRLRRVKQVIGRDV